VLDVRGAVERDREDDNSVDGFGSRTVEPPAATGLF
jgi:hypothetical protein